MISKLLQDLAPAAEHVSRLNQLDIYTNPLFLFHRYLTGHPWTIIAPFTLALIFSAIAWFYINKKILKTRSNRFFYHYLLIHPIVIAQMFAFTIVWALLIQHLSAFWIIGFTFYSFQVILPAFLIISAILAFTTKSKLRPIKDFRKLSTPLKILGITAATTILSISYYSALIEPFNIEITHHKLDLPKIELQKPLKVVHLTDIQTDFLSSREKEIVQKVSDLAPDVIVITGDYFNGDRIHNPKGFESARYVLENLEAPLGIYATSSDSNRYTDHEALFEGLPITYLENRSIQIPISKFSPTENSTTNQLYITGISRRQPDSMRAWFNVPDSAEKILIYHGPEIFFDEDDMYHEPSLILVGHTHGGQIAMPFIGPLTSATRFGRELAAGWFENGPTKMYVNRGLGMEGWWAPKVRFLARPEIAVISIQ